MDHIEEQYKKDIKTEEEVGTIIKSMQVCETEHTKHRFKVTSKTGLINYISFDRLRDYEGALRRIDIYKKLKGSEK